MTRSPALPQTLAPIEGPLPEGICEGSVLGLGDQGRGVKALVDLGWVPPDVLAGMTLHLLARQPRSSEHNKGEPKKGAIEGGVCHILFRNGLCFSAGTGGAERRVG